MGMKSFLMRGNFTVHLCICYITTAFMFISCIEKCLSLSEQPSHKLSDLFNTIHWYVFVLIQIVLHKVPDQQFSLTCTINMVQGFPNKDIQKGFFILYYHHLSNFQIQTIRTLQCKNLSDKLNHMISVSISTAYNMTRLIVLHPLCPHSNFTCSYNYSPAGLFCAIASTLTRPVSKDNTLNANVYQLQRV